MAERRSLTSLEEAERAAAYQRFEVLRPALDAGVPLAQVAREHGIALRTAQDWLRRYRQAGLA